MQARLINDEFRQDSPEMQRVLLPAGTVIDLPDCWLLVVMGIATAADAECEAMVARKSTPDAIEATRAAQQAIRDGKIWDADAGKYVAIEDDQEETEE